jgi:hypothetical protein
MMRHHSSNEPSTGVAAGGCPATNNARASVSIALSRRPRLSGTQAASFGCLKVRSLHGSDSWASTRIQ